MNVYPGYNSIKMLVEALASKGYEKSDYYIVELGKSFYAVAYGDHLHNICFGSDDVWYWNSDTLEHISFTDFKMPYFFENATKKLRTNFTMKIYSDLLKTSELIKVKKFKRIEDERPVSITTGSPIHLHYSKILARTFMDKTFTKSEVSAIRSYILMNNPDKVSKALFIRNPDLKRFNPFTLTGTLEDNSNRKIAAIFACNGELLDFKLLKQ